MTERIYDPTSNPANWREVDDEGDGFEEDEDERREAQWERDQEEMSRCWCGAYRFSEVKGELVQVADCICQ